MLQLFQIRILGEEKMELWLCCFLFVRQVYVHYSLFCTKRIAYNKKVRSLDDLNWLTGPAINIYLLKVKKGNAKSWCERRQHKDIIIIKRMARSFIMLNTMKENENSSFANISIPFIAMNMISGKGSKYCFHFPSQYST